MTSKIENNKYSESYGLDMEFRGSTEVEVDTTKDVVFQIFHADVPNEWYQMRDDLGVKKEMVSYGKKKTYTMSREQIRNVQNLKFRDFTVRLFGVTEEGHTVTCYVNGFRPYFYIMIPEEWSDTDNDEIEGEILERLRSYMDKEQDLVLSVEIDKGYNYFGFTNFKECNFAKISFRNVYGMKKATKYFYKRIRIKKETSSTEEEAKYEIEFIERSFSFDDYKSRTFQLFEADFDQTLRVFHLQGIEPCNWVRVKEYEIDSGVDTRNQINIMCNYTEIHPAPEYTSLAPGILLSYDIETFSSDYVSFPQAEKDGDEIVQIGAVAYHFSSPEPIIKYLAVLDTCDDIEGVVVERFESEEELLIGWAEFLGKLQPDIITGYNIFGFDDDYIMKRVTKHYLWNEFSCYNRIISEPVRLSMKKLGSSALGDNIFKVITCSGTTSFDLLFHIRNEFKFASYKLDDVAYELVGQRKVDLSPKELFRKCKGTSKDRMDIGVYCIQDCALVGHLVFKLNILVKSFAMANACKVPWWYLNFRGQGIKVASIVFEECNKRNFRMLTYYENDNSGSFEGAIVLDPFKGFYDKPVAVLDFMSLYPSCILADNMSPELLIEEDNEYFDKLTEDQYNEVSYEETDLNGDKKNIVCRFFKKGTCNDEMGIIPFITQTLLKKRREYKKEMKKEQDPFMKSVWDGRQLAMKVTANSVYGQHGSRFSQIRCKRLAACVTASGRNMIFKSKKYAEEIYDKHVDVKCVYGDSVVEDTPLIIKKNGEVKVVQIKDLVNHYSERMDGKEYSLITNIEILTHTGWADIMRVIRHKVNKRIYEVSTPHEVVSVTEDHSLIDDNHGLIKPNECNDMTRLLQSSDVKFSMNFKSKEEAINMARELRCC